ncbi:MAG: hypothetical protein FWG45_07310 [Oscillospiraceae bacterium]|nr:hypothetical protein [Oscillospiraceae bacterium]
MKNKIKKLLNVAPSMSDDELLSKVKTREPQDEYTVEMPQSGDYTVTVTRPWKLYGGLLAACLVFAIGVGALFNFYGNNADKAVADADYFADERNYDLSDNDYYDTTYYDTDPPAFEPFLWSFDQTHDADKGITTGETTLSLNELGWKFDWTYIHHSYDEMRDKNVNRIIATDVHYNEREFPTLGTVGLFVADIRGDGVPVFVGMHSWTSGLYSSGVFVYDYAEDELHFLDYYGTNNTLRIENGRLIVELYDNGDAESPRGALIFRKGELAIDGVERINDEQVPRWGWGMDLCSTRWLNKCGMCDNCVNNPPR